MSLIRLLDKSLNYLSVRLYAPMLPGLIKDSSFLITASINAIDGNTDSSKTSKKRHDTHLTSSSASNQIDTNFTLQNEQELLEKDVIKINLPTILNELPDFDETYDKLLTSKENDTNRTKSYFRNILTSANPVDDYPWFYKLAFTSGISEKLEKIYGKLYFCGGGVYLSTPSPSEALEGSQKWHIDRFSKKHIKVFVNLSDVSHANGPTAFINGKTTKSLLADTFTSFLTLVSKNKKKKQSLLGLKGGIIVRSAENFKKEEHNATDSCGPKGTTVIANTGVCLHQGSRCTVGKRVVLLLHFCANPYYVKKQSHDVTLGIKQRILNDNDKNKLINLFGMAWRVLCLN